jgi:IS30 family transposase
VIEHLKDDMTYKRMTEADRRHIHRWRQEGDGLRELARRLGRAASSISRELSRNTGGRGYRPKQAHEQAQKRALRPGPRRFTDEIRAEVESRLKQGLTPEIISERARLEGRPTVCKESIYQQIYCDAKAGGDLWTYLPRARRKRRRRCPRQEGRGRGKIPNQRMIDTRPAEVETRKSVGHWEGDLINGAHKTGNLTTLVERCTRYTLIGRTDARRRWKLLWRSVSLSGNCPRVHG